MGYTNEQIGYIREAYNSSKGLASIAREQLRGRVAPLPSMPNLRQIWENEGLLNNRVIKKAGRRPITLGELDSIIDRIKMYGSLKAAARKLKHSEEAVNARLSELGMLEQVLAFEKKT
ncbi:hypothetical protein HYX07_04700 [Candidatus Woesearchaeota archaeon]|nr:hypothetical protein [Candidatus Woesearchaeota archaeon]